MIAIDAGECPLSDKYSAVSEYDLFFEKSIIEARGLQYNLLGFCDEQMGLCYRLGVPRRNLRHMIDHKNSASCDGTKPSTPP